MEAPSRRRPASPLTRMACISTVLWSGFLPPQDPPSLLPPTPEDWSFERIDFPLPFAPGLEFEGYEELQFAPGFFEVDSGSYFSYCFCIQLVGEIDATPAFLRSFFEEYFRGLCAAVAPSRGLELDAEATTCTIEPREDDGVHDFVAQVRTFDAFGDGEPLPLRLELSVRTDADTTQILGLASPLPTNAHVWSQLASIRDGWKDLDPPPTFLNHLYVVPDAETYAALSSSKFLRESLAIFEERTTVRRDLTYTGIYFYGEHTYFEFLPPGIAPGFDAGATGLAFGLETAGGSEVAARALESLGIGTFPVPVTRALTAPGSPGSTSPGSPGESEMPEQVPWFRMLGVERPTATSRLSLFTMEYEPEFLRRWHPESSPSSSPRSRRAVLSRYAAAVGREEPGLFVDVTGIHLAVDEAERERILQVCRAFRYQISEVDGQWTCRGPGFTLTLRTSPGPGGVTGFEMSLREAVEREPLRLGRATLEFSGRTATLSFGG